MATCEGKVPAFISPLVTWIKIWEKLILPVAGKDAWWYFFQKLDTKLNFVLKKKRERAKYTQLNQGLSRNKQTKDRSQSK